MKRWIRELLKWAAPELFEAPIAYVCIDGAWIMHRGEFLRNNDGRGIPWQVTFPRFDHYGFSMDCMAPYEFTTYYRERGSLDPVIYRKLEVS